MQLLWIIKLISNCKEKMINREKISYQSLSCPIAKGYICKTKYSMKYMFSPFQLSSELWGYKNKFWTEYFFINRTFHLFINLSKIFPTIFGLPYINTHQFINMYIPKHIYHKFIWDLPITEKKLNISILYEHEHTQLWVFQYILVDLHMILL